MVKCLQHYQFLKHDSKHNELDIGRPMTSSVMSRSTSRLNLPWNCEKFELPRSCLDEHFLLGHNRPASTSLPILPDLHTEVERSWCKPHSAHILLTQVNYAVVAGMQECGYALRPLIKETLAGFLSG